MSNGARPSSRVLVVDTDAARRRRLREHLAAAGARVIEAARPEEVGQELGDLDGAVVGCADSESLQLVADLARRYPHAKLVLEAERGVAQGRPCPWLVAPGDVAGVLAALDLSPTAKAGRVIDLVPAELVGAEAAQLVEAWTELCQWDPLLPPESRPPIASDVIAAVGAALARPQPLGYGTDPMMEGVAERFAASLTSLDEAIEQLVCLREALRRRILNRMPPGEALEPLARMDMVIDRAIGVASRSAAARLEQEALLDPLTGLRNRRALEQDLARELSRAARHTQPLAVVVIDVIGLKVVNDREGHPAGDRLLRSLADALRKAVRGGDLAYRIGGDEFALVLIETDAGGTAHAMERLAASGAPDVRWGAAVYPHEGADAAALLARADDRLLARPGLRG